MRCKTHVCSSSIPGIAGCNPAEGMPVRLFCVGSGLCDEQLTRLERERERERERREREYVCVCVCLIVCNAEISTTRPSSADLGCCATEKNIVVKKLLFSPCYFYHFSLFIRC